MIRASSVLLSYIEGKHCGCWLLVLLTKFGCYSNQADEIVFFPRKNNFASRPMNRPSTSGSSAAMFRVDMYPDRSSLASETSDQMIRLDLSRILRARSAVPFVQKKLPRIPLSFYRLGETRSHKKLSNGMDFSGYSDFPPTSLDKSKISEWNSGNCPFTPPPGIFRNFSKCVLDAQTPLHVSKLGY